MEKIRTDIMGMPIRVVIPHETDQKVFEEVFQFFEEVDEEFSPYKSDSVVSKYNRDELSESEKSLRMQEVLSIAEDTKKRTRGYFNSVRPDGVLDPSGVVKGWAIKKAEELLVHLGHDSYLIDIAGDVATRGTNEKGESWRVGIQSPFNHEETVLALEPRGRGVATSGSYVRGAHIYDPIGGAKLEDIVSLTVVARDVLEADLLATSAFAMGEKGIVFLETLPDVEGYTINSKGTATMTSGLKDFKVL